MIEVAALVLAAGRASRYRAAGGAAPTKLVAPYRGKPLVRWAVEAALASRARPVVVVTGHARAEVEEALSGLDVSFVHNPDFADGLSTSLRAGIASLEPNRHREERSDEAIQRPPLENQPVDHRPAGSLRSARDDGGFLQHIAGAVILLGDMPDASAATIDALIAAFADAPQSQAAVPIFAGRRGNPALLGRALFARAAALTGDEGARGLLQNLDPARLLAMPVSDGGVGRDMDTPDDFGARDG